MWFFSLLNICLYDHMCDDYLLVVGLSYHTVGGSVFVCRYAERCPVIFVTTCLHFLSEVLPNKPMWHFICLFSFSPAALFVEKNVLLKYFFTPRLSDLCLSAFYLAFLQPCDFCNMSPPPGIQIFRLEDGSRRNLLLWRMKSCVPSDFEMPQKLLHVIAQAWWEIWAKAVIWQFLQKWGGKAIILNACVSLRGKVGLRSPSSTDQSSRNPTKSALLLSSLETAWQLAATQLWPLTLIQWPAAINTAFPAARQRGAEM